MVYKLFLRLNIIENSKAINTKAVNTKFYTFTYKEVYWQVFEFNWLSCLGFRIAYYYISTYVCVSPVLKVRHSCSSHMFITHVCHTCTSHMFVTQVHHTLFSRESDSTFTNVHPFVRSFICPSFTETPPTAWNHYPSSFFIILHHPYFILQLLSFSACYFVSY